MLLLLPAPAHAPAHFAPPAWAGGLFGCKRATPSDMAEGNGIDVEAYYRQFGPMVFRRCRTLLRDEERAKDAMQETFIRLLRKQDVLQHNAPSSLLYRIATNVCLNIIRSQKRHPEDRDEALLLRIACADDPESKSHARRMLGRLFAREAESSRTIAVLYLLDGMTHEEVASAVGMSVSGVRKRLRKMRKTLHEMEENA